MAGLLAGLSVQSSDGLAEGEQEGDRRVRARSTRCYCPVPGCPAGDAVRSAGWQSVQALRQHLDEHAAGRLTGSVPNEWLANHNLGQCTVCSRLLSTRFGNSCPRCRPAMQSATAPAVGRPLLPNSPSVPEACESKVPVKLHVPKGARQLWGQCVLTALADVNAHNDDRAWADLFALPKLVLQASGRGGKAHSKRLESETKLRCRSWLEGHRSKLEGPRAGRTRRGEQRAEDERRVHERVAEFLREGLLHRGCAALLQTPPAEVTEAVVREMSAKHPPAREGEQTRRAALRPVSAAAAAQADGEAVLKALNSFPRLSGAGPSGLRPQHLKEALVPGLRDEVIRQLTLLVNRLAKGDVPADVRPWLCGASLVALKKETGDLRPIAVGETLRRLTAKVLCSAVSAEVRQILEPLQVGVGTPGGAESVVHVLRQWLCRNRAEANKVIASLDLSNAFNSVDRSRVMSAVRHAIPSLAPWVDLCYGEDSYLLLGSRRLASACGVQQGDPLGPPLFALALREAIDLARAAALAEYPDGLDVVVFYLDDANVAGDAQAVAAFCRHFQEHAAAFGLSLSLDKSCVHPSAGSASSVAPGAFQGWQWRPDGIKVLGAPLGSPVFCDAITAKRVLKAERL
ncbi:MAG: hypothetical protein FJ284_15705, partial [Planctomycetes bacterium]|nr:hypothetical protein [Planctomycetota bacterium]